MTHVTGADWDKVAEVLEEDSSRAYRYAMCMRYLEEASPSASVCDVGCGEGSGLLQLRAAGFAHVTGIEVSGERLRHARTRVGDAHLVHIAGEGDLPFSDASFDAVISAAVIEHTADPEHHVRELARVTKAGGMVVIASDCYMYRVAQLLGLYRSPQPIDRAIFPLALLRYFRRSGLDLVHAEGFPIPGEEFRFLRLVRLALKRTLRRVLRRRAAARHEAVKSEPVPPPAAKSWRPGHWLPALPALLYSDENVFYLKKRVS